MAPAPIEQAALGLGLLCLAGSLVCAAAACSLAVCAAATALGRGACVAGAHGLLAAAHLLLHLHGGGRATGAVGAALRRGGVAWLPDYYIIAPEPAPW